MASAMQAYGVGNVVVIVDQMPPITGFAPGDDFFDIKRAEDAAEDEMSGDGTQMAVSLNPDLSGSIILKIQWASPSNAQLMILYNQQVLASRGKGILIGHTVRVQDTYRNDLDTLSPCYIKKLPDRTRGKKAKDMVWEFRGAQLDPQHGPGIPVVSL
jgi:hypothetical protein